jgi:hypothetical protein
MRARRDRPILLLAVALAACGLDACGASPSAHATPVAPHPTLVASAPTATSSPTPTPSPPVLVPPLLGYDTAGHAILFNESGTPTATLPRSSLYSAISPLGSDLLATRLDPATQRVDGLAAIDPGGDTRLLSSFAPATDFIDAIGSPDGSQWAWMVQGSGLSCAGEAPPRMVTDMYVQAAGANPRLVATLPSLGLGINWTFYQWTNAGIVLDEGGRPGCYTGPRVNVQATDLLDPASGRVTKFKDRIGVDCILQDIGDDGSAVCMMRPFVVANGRAVGPLLHVVSPAGIVTTVSSAPFVAACPGPIEFGDVTMSRDARFVSLSGLCSRSSSDSTDMTWVIDAHSAAIARSSVDGLEAMGWLPDRDLLVASGQLMTTTVGPTTTTPGTYEVAPSGTATRLSSAALTWTSFAHY